MSFFGSKKKVSDADLKSKDDVSLVVQASISTALSAQLVLESQREENVNNVLSKITTAVISEARALANLNVEESGMGLVDDKVAKIMFSGNDVFTYVKDKPGCGVISDCPITGITEIASPVGLVFGLVPLTNPVSTLLFKTIIALKTRNAIIFSCHRETLRVCAATFEIIHKVLAQVKLPCDLVQMIDSAGNRELVREFMAHEKVSMILATGGNSVVKAAYRSGTPAIGVGSGNAPVMVCDDANMEAVAETVVMSKSFDNGVICGSENNLVVTSLRYKYLKAQLELANAAVLDDLEVSRLGKAILDKNGVLKRECLGKTAEALAKKANIERDHFIRLLVVPVSMNDLDSFWLREKLAPILSLVLVGCEPIGFDLCRSILLRQGAGHTAVIHTYDENKIERFSLAVPVGRVLVNVPASHGCIGMVNHLAPSLTLGCGTWGGGSTTDNVSMQHLMNIKRVVRRKPASSHLKRLPKVLAEAREWAGVD